MRLIEMWAAIAHQLAAKYQFTAAMAPGLRVALGLDTQPVQQAHLRFTIRRLRVSTLPRPLRLIVFVGPGTDWGVGWLATLQSATIPLPVTRANEIKMLAHQITPEGNSLALPVTAELDAHGSARQVNLMGTGGQVTLPLDNQASQLTLTLGKKTSSAHWRPGRDGHYEVG
jgi:hypothetical protein